MENREIPVNRDEYARLCALDGKMDALIGYLATEESELVYKNVIKAIIGMEDELMYVGIGPEKDTVVTEA